VKELLAQIAARVALGIIGQVMQWQARKPAHKFERDMCVRCGCDLSDPKDKRWSQPCANAGA
jgi:hypothetical protein